MRPNIFAPISSLWHFTIAFIDIPSSNHTKLALNLRCNDPHYISATHANSHTLYIRVTPHALTDYAVQVSMAIVQGQPLPVVQLIPLRVFKWVDAQGSLDSATAYRSALTANVLAHTAAELARICHPQNIPEHTEIVRGRVDPPNQETAREHGRIFELQLVSKCMSNMLEALHARGSLRHATQPNNLSTMVCIPGQRALRLITDGHGVVSQLAMNACAIFGLMCENDAPVIWHHFVLNSQRYQHWENAIRVAELAFEFTRGQPKITNMLCPVGCMAIGSPNLLTASLLSSLNLVPSGDNSFIQGPRQDLLTALHGRILSTSANTCAIDELLMDRTNCGWRLHTVHARLCHRLAAPNSQSSATQTMPQCFVSVAFLISALPETMYRTLDMRKTTGMLDYLIRLARTTSACLDESGPEGILEAARIVLNLGLRIIGASPH
ncbi:hypothetical protein LPJ66_005334 [Kickxella alabastrina]|uniref:Uncharacterized protein n=1 Tax=Kickxella alabastrina TaxID=61397 RepID=A0ACC1IF24_9FUNG|nr:hypothetical protein LPJ66_005334 [Kickxella alabastrina]